MKKTHWFMGLVLVFGVVISAVAFSKRVEAENKRKCGVHLSNYNLTINSFGIRLDCYEVWKDPKKTELRALDEFGMKIPSCPSGGSYSIVYGRGFYPELPRLVCSMEDSHDHIDEAIRWQEDESRK